MLGLGGHEILIIIGVMVLLFGGISRLPQLGKNLGLGIREFRDVFKEFKSTKDDIDDSVKQVANEFKNVSNEIKKETREINTIGR